MDGEPSPRRLPAGAGTVAAFALLGPPIGGVAYIVAATLYGVAAAGPPPGGLFAALALLSLTAIPFSYLFGLVPALLVGLAATPLRSRLGGFVYVVLCAMAGGALCVATAWLLFSVESKMLLLLAGPGGLAGLICAVITRPRRPVESA